MMREIREREAGAKVIHPRICTLDGTIRGTTYAAVRA